MSVYIKEPDQKAHACVIWMHGLGADASDMMGVASELNLNDVAVRHLFIDAPLRPVTLNGGMMMPAWYDILGLELVDREDKEGIEESESLIREVMDTQIKDGFDYKMIYLAGFSQGGAMALHTALHTEGQLGGVIALSGYLPLAREIRPKLNKNTPFFMGSGQFDPMVLPAWTQLSKEIIHANGYQKITIHQYPMEHSICMDEIKDLSFWITAQVREGLL